MVYLLNIVNLEVIICLSNYGIFAEHCKFGATIFFVSRCRLTFKLGNTDFFPFVLQDCCNGWWFDTDL
jgi:hypothetical protein